MAGIRNQCVARGVLNTSGAYLVFLVPANTVLLVKNIFATAYAIATTTFKGYVMNETQSVAPYFMSVPIQTNAFHSEPLWFALNPGDSLHLQIDQSPLSYWVSGAVLEPAYDLIHPQLAVYETDVTALPAVLAT